MTTTRTLTAVCAALIGLVAAPSARAIIVVDNHDRFPIPGSIYQSDNGTTYPSAGGFDVEMVSMSLSGSIGGDSIVVPPTSGPAFQVDSFFDVFTELSIDGGGSTFQVDSFFDITYEITYNSGGSDTTGNWDTEIISMSLSGNIPGGPPIVIQESPTLPSTGQHTITDLGGGSFQIDSFFDVFTEISISGGPFVAADSSVKMTLTTIVPEPSTLALAAFGFLGLAAWSWRRRKR